MRYLLLLLISFQLHAFETIPNQKLPSIITFSCDDIVSTETQLVLDSWNFSADNAFTFVRVNHDGVIDIKLVPSLPGTYAALTGAHGSSASIQISLEYLHNFSGVLMHEVGHAFGLDHSKDPAAVMNIDYSIRVGLIGQDDIDGIRFIYGLSPKTFTFNSKVRGSRVALSITPEFDKKSVVGWSESGQLFGLGKAKLYRTFPRGTYTISLQYLAIRISKTVEIKKRR